MGLRYGLGNGHVDDSIGHFGRCCFLYKKQEKKVI